RFMDACKTINLCRFHGPMDGWTDRNVGIGARSDLTRAVALPSLLEIGPAVALALRQADGIHVDGDDAEGAGCIPPMTAQGRRRAWSRDRGSGSRRSRRRPAGSRQAA